MNENVEGVRRRIASGTSLDRVRAESSHSLDRLSTASPVRWDSLLQNLSEALPVIFHTPPPAEKHNNDLLHKEPHVCSDKHLHPEPSALGDRGSVIRGSLNASERRRPVSGLCRPESGKDVETASQSSGRVIRVRHEETEEKLNQSLSMICRPKSPRAPPDDLTGRSVGLRLKESLKSGVRMKIDISKYEHDKIVVAVTTDNVLRVYLAGDKKVLLHSHQLPPNPPLQSLVCSIVDGTSLYIREKSKEAMVLEHNSQVDRFLPVMAIDEASLKFTVIIHIPNEVTFEDLVVKTVDESLVIKGQQGNGSGRQTGDVLFRIMMALPEGADTRSVTARVIELNQVVIEGYLSLASRRMTCNF